MRCYACGSIKDGFLKKAWVLVRLESSWCVTQSVQIYRGLRTKQSRPAYLPVTAGCLRPICLRKKSTLSTLSQTRSWLCNLVLAHRHRDTKTRKYTKAYTHVYGQTQNTAIANPKQTNIIDIFGNEAFSLPTRKSQHVALPFRILFSNWYCRYRNIAIFGTHHGARVWENIVSSPVD